MRKRPSIPQDYFQVEANNQKNLELECFTRDNNLPAYLGVMSFIALITLSLFSYKVVTVTVLSHCFGIKYNKRIGVLHRHMSICMTLITVNLFAHVFVPVSGTWDRKSTAYTIHTFFFWGAVAYALNLPTSGEIEIPWIHRANLFVLTTLFPLSRIVDQLYVWYDTHSAACVLFVCLSRLH